MHSVDQQRDEIEVIKGRTPPGRELRGRARDEAAADRALAGPRLFISGPTGTKLRAYWRVATPTSICSTTRRSHLAGRRPHARALNRDLPAARTSLRVVPARLAGRSGSCAYRGPQIAVRSSSSIVVKTFVQSAAPIPTGRSWCRRADRRAADDAGTIPGGERARLCETSSWRLLVVRPCGLGLSHHSFYTSSEEPLISIFNSYWDIPIGRVGEAWRVD